jgi:hypothetical protein
MTHIIDSRTRNRSVLTTGLLVAVVAVLLFLQFRGCRQSKIQLHKFNKIDSLNNVLLHAVSDDKLRTDSAKKAFQDSLEFERGQRAILEAQKERTEAELDDITKENKALITKYKIGQYTDTSSVTVPGEFITDCQGCFVKLEKTTGLVERYKKDINKIQDKWDEHDKMYQKRFRELDEEKLGFYNKINTLAKAQQKAIDELKPHGRLYLSWGVLWRPWPVAGGVGLMYQNKRNLIWGLKGYYGQGGTTVETNVNLPLSLRKIK